MSYCTHAVTYKTPFDVRLEKLGPAARMFGQGLLWLGGGVVFAVTVFVMVAIPGFIE